ncbi:MAG: 2Fe-2S iron-sulfur cluster-binding protein [Gemmatimonadales bacterium]
MSAMPQDLVSVTIDGRQVSVPKGTPIIEAAKQAGVLVPHYCYHPSLPSPAVCRMCLVEVEKAPKLMPACVTAVAEGQVVHTQGAAAKKAREGVLELLLINHPLDCPICDQSGECELQDYTFQEGRAAGRYADYPKRFNPVEDFGPDILYVVNRCILCTRCVRFMEDVAKDAILNISERGDRACVGIDPAHALDHPWAGNVVDLCPVGSLLSKDFLHKARAWDLDKTASVCTGCSQGCNTTVDTRDDVVVRLRPRPNLDVNRHFICDTGRLDYRWMNRGDRVEAPLIRDGQKLAARDWPAAFEQVGQLVEGAKGSVVVLASGRASNESLGEVRGLLEGRSVTAAIRVPMGETEAPLVGVPDLALRKERAPNGAGGRLLGYSASWDAALTACAGAALVLVIDVELSDAERAAVSKAGAVIALASVDQGFDGWATAVLPVTTTVEESGTFTNRDGRVQRFWPARSAPGMARPAWWVAAELRSVVNGRQVPANADAAFAALAASVPAFAGMSYADLGFTGRRVEPVGAVR